jgi:hypothetical protein
MIDLETLGLDVDTAPIIQIGAVAFQLTGDGPDARTQMFRLHVDAKSCMAEPFNRRIEPGTVAWWAETDPVLLADIMKGKGTSLEMALVTLTDWFARLGGPPEGVWGNGPTFDIVMLEAAYKQAGLPVPWSYRAIRDVRTVAMIAGDDDLCWNGGTKTTHEEGGKAHDVVVDCLRQLRMVQQTWKRKVRHVANT